MQKIPLSKCFIDAEVEAAALRALRSGQYILGRECQAFETELAASTGTRHCVLGSSWTMLVYLLHRAQGLQPGDEVLLPAHTAFPTMEPLIHCGARPVFVDIDDTFCLDVAHLESLVTPRTVGIIPVHLYGHLEDCAQAQGAQYRGQTVGSHGLAGAFSFFPSKNLTVLGDGGCLTTNDGGLADQLRRLRNHGRVDKHHHEITGYNVRFNEIQAAIGRVMLPHLDAFNAQRRAIARRYTERLRDLVVTPGERPWATAVYHMYVIRAERRDALQKFLRERGVETGIHYPTPNHQQPAVIHQFPNPPVLPRTEQAVREILSLPIHGTMALADADRVADLIAEFYGRKSR